MLEDVLYIKDIHKKAASLLVDRIPEKRFEKYVLAIGGESGCGKSVISHLVGKILKEQSVKVKILHTDNYYKTLPKERTLWRMKHGIENVGLDEYDFNKITEDIKAFKNNEKAVLPCVDLLSDQVDLLETDFSDIHFLIVEGLYSLKVLADLKVFIDLTYMDTLGANNRRCKEVLNDFRLDVLKREHKVVLKLKCEADFLITRDFDLIENLRGAQI